MSNELIKNNDYLGFLEENKNVPKKSITLLKEKLPEISRKTKVFNRTNSQSTLNMMTLTMLNGVSPMRQLKQILAEIEKRESALADSQIRYIKLIECKDLFESDDSEKLRQAKQRLNDYNISMLESKISGSIKDLSTLINTYERLIKKHGIENWSEYDFELAENKHHIRRGFELLYRNLMEFGRPKDSSLEYLQQYGVHPQKARLEVMNYIQKVEHMLEENEELNSVDLEEFLNEMSEKYLYCAEVISAYMYDEEKLTVEEFTSNNNNND